MADNQNNLRLNSIDTVAIGQPQARYGVAVPAELGRRYPANAAAIGTTTRFSFMLAEITGLLFVVITTLYIFAMPTSLTRNGRLGVMLNSILKRSLDIVGSVFGLLCSLPFFIIVPIIIKLESRGPIFYSQVRVGQNRRNSGRRYQQTDETAIEKRDRDRRRQDYMGSIFKVYKFRTMQVDAESKSGPVWAVKSDPRITRIGKFLRKTRIDEIPQFWCVLIGDMSLVGPRPERPHFVSELSGKVEGYSGRLQAKPGLTGLAQIEVGYDSSIAAVAKKVESDLKYIDNCSVWLDLKILCKTVVVVLTGKGAN